MASEVPIDLETICLKCLEKDPAKRYQSAAELASELCRFNNGQPILARPISSLGRDWRWCGRNPVLAGLLTSLFVSMFLSLAGVTTQWRRAEANAEFAATEAARAYSAAQLASSEVNRATKATNAEHQSRLQAEQAEARAETSTIESTKNAETARRVSDFMEGIFQGADRLGVRGSQFGQFGNQEGDPTARQLLDRGTQLIETELQDEPEIRATVMATIAETYATLGSVDDTERLANSTLEILKELHGDTPTEQTADMLNLLAIARYTEGNYDAAIPLGRQAVQIYDDLYGKLDPRGAPTKLFLGTILMESGFDDDTVAEAIAKSRKHFGRQPRTAWGLYYYGMQLSRHKKKLDVAVKVLSESAQIYGEILGEQNRQTIRTRKTLANVMEQIRQMEEAKNRPDANL